MGEASDDRSIEMVLNDRYRGHDTRDWQAWAAMAVDSAAEVPLDATRALVRRTKASHRGIAERQQLTHLIAAAPDQAFLDEICQITSLERLELEWPVTAKTLDGLTSLTRLRHLSIDSPRNITDFTPLLRLPALRTLLITNAKNMADIEWLSDAHHLEVIGVEGSMWTDQRITTLRPLAGLRSLEAFLATSVRLGDKDLSPLIDCPKLRYLGCARFAPREEFERLQAARPDIECSWFHPEPWDLLKGP